MDKDSAVLATGMSDENEGLNPCQFWIVNIPWHDSYILKFTCVGFETTFVPLTVKKNQSFVDMGNVVMKRSARLLDEVVVTATKIKMVVDGDTLIYNADAFQLSEGSMLDNLVKQLPGVELNNSGQITVNGRYVSSLLLNGKDFFKGDPRVALENLPAYMVDKVKVYEKERGDAYLMKNKSDLDKDLVMDVNLKRQYSIGFLANAEAGHGSGDRYLGRVFGLRFTNHSRLSFYGNANNLNQNQKPGSSGEWDNQWAASGQTAMKRAGLDFQLHDKKGAYQLNSNLNAQFEDTDNRTSSSGVAYLTDFDRYTFGRNHYDNKNTSVTTNHELIAKKPYFWSKFTASAGYSRWDNHGFDQGAELSEKVTETYRGEVLDSLFSPGQYVSFASALINSRRENGKMNGDQYNAKLYAYVSLRDYKLVANASYDKRTAKEFSQYGLNYARAMTDFRNRYTDMSSERYAYDIMAQYGYDLGDLTVQGSYTFAGSQITGDKALYRLDGYDGWDSFDGHSLGHLPSTRDSLFQVVDLPAISQKNRR